MLAEAERLERSIYALDQDDHDDGYDHLNPPPSEDAALERLVEVEITMGHIESALQNRKPNPHDPNERFDFWRQKATNKLGWMIAERRFLLWWYYERPVLEEKRSKSKKQEPVKHGSR